MTIEHLRRREAIDGLESEWRRLLDDSALNSIFLTWEWLSAWLDHYLAPGDEPWVLVLREGGRLVGIAPLLRQIQRRRGRPSVRLIRFLGTGEPEAEEVVSESMDIIALPGLEKTAVVAVAQYLLDHSAEWDKLFFQDIREQSFMRLHLLPHLTAAGLPIVEQSEWLNYTVHLEKTLEAYIGSLPKRRRYQFNRLLREFNEQQGKFCLLTEPGELDRYFQELIRLHRSRWQTLNQQGIFISPRVKAFHAQVLRTMLEANKLHLSLIVIGGKSISADYCFNYKGTLHNYQGGFDPEFEGIQSVGTLHFLLCFQKNMLLGNHTFDFLKTRANDVTYKKTFGCVPTPLYDLSVFNRNLGGRMLRLEHGLRQQYRRIRNRFRQRQEDASPMTPANPSE